MAQKYWDGPKNPPRPTSGVSVTNNSGMRGEDYAPPTPRFTVPPGNGEVQPVTTVPGNIAENRIRRRGGSK